MKALNNLLMIAAISTLTTMAFAQNSTARAAAKEVFDLKDGSTVYIFKDGKMSMEDKFGRATRMEPDTVMETKDGVKIIMHGDEVARLDSLFKRDRTGKGR